MSLLEEVAQNSAPEFFKGVLRSWHTHGRPCVHSYPTERSGNAAILEGRFGEWYLVKGTVRSGFLMYFHGATVRSVESTSGVKDAWGLLKRPTSAKAVTRRCPREGFFTRNDGFKYFTVMPTSSGRRKTFYCSNSSN